MCKKEKASRYGRRKGRGKGGIENRRKEEDYVQS
jgi:hypothetical protein